MPISHRKQTNNIQTQTSGLFSVYSRNKFTAIQIPLHCDSWIHLIIKSCSSSELMLFNVEEDRWSKAGPRANQQNWTFNTFPQPHHLSKQSPSMALSLLPSAANQRLLSVRFGDLACFPFALWPWLLGRERVRCLSIKLPNWSPQDRLGTRGNIARQTTKSPEWKNAGSW